MGYIFEIQVAHVWQLPIQAKIDWKFEVVIIANWPPATTIKDVFCVFSFVVIKTIMDIVFMKIYRAIKYVFSRNNLHLEFHKKNLQKTNYHQNNFLFHWYFEIWQHTLYIRIDKHFWGKLGLNFYILKLFWDVFSNYWLRLLMTGLVTTWNLFT